MTDGAFRTAAPGVFAVGNLLRGVEPAAVAAAEGARRRRPYATSSTDSSGPMPECRWKRRGRFGG